MEINIKKINIVLIILFIFFLKKKENCPGTSTRRCYKQLPKDLHSLRISSNNSINSINTINNANNNECYSNSNSSIVPQPSF